jgi:hypothetical protein
MISKHNSIKFFIFFCLLLFSCNNEQIENQILTFDESKADIEINLYENENNFIEYFIEKTKNKYKNEETFELWAINAFNKKLKYLNNLDSKLLMELNYTILKKQYTNLGYTIGNKTL